MFWCRYRKRESQWLGSRCVLREVQEVMRQISLWQEYWWRQCTVCGDEIIADSHYVPVFETQGWDRAQVYSVPKLIGHAHVSCMPEIR